MSLRKTTTMIKLFLSIVLLLGISTAGKWAERPAPPTANSLGINSLMNLAEFGEPTDCQQCFRMVAGTKSASCEAPTEEELAVESPTSRIEASAARVVKVSSLVERALKDQKVMLMQRLEELKRWNPEDRGLFTMWFGTTSDEARRMIQIRVLRVLELNKNYSVSNFRRGKHREGVYAYVYPSQPSKIYLDDMFVKQTATGEDSRVCTITHEMSHFTIIGGTKDHIYGLDQSKKLAREDVNKALTNADNFGFWVEGAR